MSTLKAIANNNLYVNQNMKFVCHGAQKHVEIGENAGYQNFYSFSCNVFKTFFPRVQ